VSACPASMPVLVARSTHSLGTGEPAWSVTRPLMLPVAASAAPGSTTTNAAARITRAAERVHDP